MGKLIKKEPSIREVNDQTERIKNNPYNISGWYPAKMSKSLPDHKPNLFQCSLKDKSNEIAWLGVPSIESYSKIKAYYFY